MGDTEALALAEATRGMSSHERANAVRHASANSGKPTGKQRREAAEEAQWAAQSGPVPVAQAPAPAGDDW